MGRATKVRWTTGAIASVRRLVETHGLRVMCAACRWEGRHYPQAGRIREADCGRCGARELHGKAWAKRYPESWQREVDRAHSLQFAFNRFQ